MSLQCDQQRHQECQLQEDEHAHNDHPAEQEAQDLAQGYFLTQGASVMLLFTAPAHGEHSFS